jgi:hypothetical protein
MKYRLIAGERLGLALGWASKPNLVEEERSDQRQEQHGSGMLSPPVEPTADRR